MNILFITNTLPPVVDGVGDYTINIAREFARHGHNVSIVCKRDKRVKADYTDVKVLPIVAGWNKKAALLVKELIIKDNVDIVSLQYVPHGFEPHGLPFGLIGFITEIKKTRVKVFTFCHEVYWKYRGYNLKYLAESLLMAYISKRILLCSDYVATSISYYAQMIEGLCRKAVKTIPIASNIPVFPIDSHISTLKSKVAPNGEFIIAFIGKREMKIVGEAIRRLIDENVSIKVLLIGKTNNLTNVEDKYIYRTGILDINDLSQYVAVADCMVMPENKETGCSFKSGSLAAALSFGLPVITSKGIMTDDILQDKENILFVDSQSIIAFHDAIASLLNNKALVDEIANNARAIGNKLTWENTHKEYANLYQRSYNE